MPPPPPPRQITAVKSNQSTSTPYSIELLTEYAHTLDSMPIDLSRIFADLRELDAVLTSTVASVTEKVYQLVELIETKSASPEQRLWLLGEIAEEASRVRPGADDKIRIATQAADNLHFQRQHLTSLATHLPEFEPAMLVPKTRYPHVSARANLPPHIYETGRRRRPPQNANTWMGANESPAKKRRVVQEEDLDYGVVGKSPRKDKTGEGSRSRGGPRAKKTERNPSPDSVRSAASPMPPATNHRGNSSSATASQKNAASSSKRRANPSGHGEGSLLESVLSRKDNHLLAPSSSTSHPSLVDGHDNKRDKDYWVDGQTDTPANGSNKARGSSANNNNHASAMEDSPAPATGAVTGTPATAAGDLDPEIEADADDGRVYCICDGHSYGEMIGCDQPGCKREWFHLMCVGLSEAPKGVWYCEECTATRKKNARNGKKRSGGGRNGRNGS
ncbi:hypothetical protein PNOK_0277300 [Pyrrhoderma noxium]|uniref:Chromatin modification-related protein n=1 Tax=Pyrrhoderma noxium TaxID=2282107 RepID=A0A286UT76_9AGAM|nr:hypothetical protein PNOK_0277300 [Pyrrhoderma noxium]